MTTTEDDLRTALFLESWDVGAAQEILPRLSDAPPRRSRTLVVALPVIAVALAALIAVVVTRPGPVPTPDRPSPAGVPHGLSLLVSKDLTVTSYEHRRDSDVMHVAHRPNAQNSYDGGAVTLFRRGVFAARTFVGHATRIELRGRPAYFGSYPFFGRVGMDPTLAYRLGDGRWVVVQGFIGLGTGSDSRQNLTAELRVARAVRIG